MDIPGGKFWCCFRAQFPNLAKKAFEVLLFHSLPPIGVSNRFQLFNDDLVNNKQRNRLEAMFPHDMRLNLSTTEPPN